MVRANDKQKVDRVKTIGSGFGSIKGREESRAHIFDVTDIWFTCSHIHAWDTSLFSAFPCPEETNIVISYSFLPKIRFLTPFGSIHARCGSLLHIGPDYPISVAATSKRPSSADSQLIDSLHTIQTNFISFQNTSSRCCSFLLLA